MGEDNFWQMGDTGPCGPSSEIYFDKGDAYGAPGGPAHGGAERFVEIWNLVFMQFNRQVDGSLVELPRKNIDTGAGLERILPILQGTDSIFATDVLAPLVAAAERLTDTRYGVDDRADVALRVLADHGRAMAMLVADGVLPSNEGRGYVLRRLIRRAVLSARRLGTERPVTTGLAEAAAAVMGQAYPQVVHDLSLVQSVLEREEAGFDRTLRTGLTLLEGALDEAGRGSGTLGGDIAFRLHDTHGFPIELTEELAREADVAVDRDGFDAPDGGPAGPGPAGRPLAGGGRRGRLPGPARGRGRDRLRRVGPPTSTPCTPGWWGSWPVPSRGRPRCSWTRRPSTPRAGARWATPAPSSPRPAGPRSTRPCRSCPA